MRVLEADADSYIDEKCAHSLTLSHLKSQGQLVTELEAELGAEKSARSITLKELTEFKARLEPLINELEAERAASSELGKELEATKEIGESKLSEAVAEIERLKFIADSRAPQVDALKKELDKERIAHGYAREQLADTSDLTKELAAAKVKLESLIRWISTTHGLAGLRTAGGNTVDILKLNKKNENKITVSVPDPAPSVVSAGG